MGWGGRGAGIPILSPASRHPHSHVPDPGPGPPVPRSSVRGPLWKLVEEQPLLGRLESAFQSQVSLREAGSLRLSQGPGLLLTKWGGGQPNKSRSQSCCQEPLPGRDPGASMRQASKGDGPRGASDRRIPPRLSIAGGLGGWGKTKWRRWALSTLRCLCVTLPPLDLELPALGEGGGG